MRTVALERAVGNQIASCLRGQWGTRWRVVSERECVMCLSSDDGM